MESNNNVLTAVGKEFFINFLESVLVDAPSGTFLSERLNTSMKFYVEKRELKTLYIFIKRLMIMIIQSLYLSLERYCCQCFFSWRISAFSFIFEGQKRQGMSIKMLCFTPQREKRSLIIFFCRNWLTCLNPRYIHLISCFVKLVALISSWRCSICYFHLRNVFLQWYWAYFPGSIYNPMLLIFI